MAQHEHNFLTLFWPNIIFDHFSLT